MFLVWFSEPPLAQADALLHLWAEAEVNHHQIRASSIPGGCRIVSGIRVFLKLQIQHWIPPKSSDKFMKNKSMVLTTESIQILAIREEWNMK